MSIDFHVEITSEGRSGSVIYREGEGRKYLTWWEFAAGNGVLAFVKVDSPEKWDTRAVWAAGRREQILERIAREIIRQKAPGYSYKIEDDFINIVPTRQ